MPSQIKKFEETIGFLLEELALAKQWDRPSILLAVHRSKNSQGKAEIVLKKKLNKNGTNVVEIKIDHESPDAAHLILAAKADIENDVFFISNIDQGGGDDGRNAYRALNLFRENFVENKIKAIFWLTINEEIKLPKYAPDFWAFRHRVVEFSSTHQTRKPIPPSGLLLWGLQNHEELPGAAKEKIIARKRLLAELTDSLESLSTRIDLLQNLGYLYWTLGDATQASEALNFALDLANREEYSDIKIFLKNGLAIISYELGHYQEAFDILKDLVDQNPKSSWLKINLTVVLSALGKNYLAITQGGRVLKQDSTNPEIMYTLGYLYFSLGKLDAAVDLLKKSIQLAPSKKKTYEILGVCFGKMGLLDDAKVQFSHAANLGGDRVVFSKICEEVLFGNLDKAVAQAKDAIVFEKITRHEVLCDPTLNAVFGNLAIQAIIK